MCGSVPCLLAHARSVSDGVRIKKDRKVSGTAVWVEESSQREEKFLKIASGIPGLSPLFDEENVVEEELATLLREMLPGRNRETLLETAL